MTTPIPARPRIVVGVDGSDPSRDALRWALKYAHGCDFQVEAVTAWDCPPFFSAHAAPSADEAIARSDAERLLATAVADATRDDARAHISTRVVRGAPDEVLLAVAHGASTLVVGRRSRKSLTHSVLSGPSVSRRCTKKAACRVVVVRESSP